MLKKKFGLMALIAMFAFSSCGKKDKASDGKASEDSKVIKLGNSGPLTGPLSVYGKTCQNGIQLAIDEINKNGGIDGKQVEWTGLDDKGEITEAVTNYNKLMEDKVNAILGGIPSKPTLAMAESAAKDEIVYITPTGTQANITEGKDNVFRVCFTDPFQGEVLANFAADKLKAKKLAILRNQSSDYSMGVADVFKETAKKAGMEVVADESYGDNDTDFKAQLTKIKSENVDVLLIPDYYEKVALISSQVRDSGIKATLLGADGWDGVLSVMDQSSFKDVEGSYFSNQFSLDDPSEKCQKFIKDYKEKYKEDPTTFAAEGYDTVYLYKQAVEEAKTTKWDEVVKALKNIKFDGITGSFKFDENNNPRKTAKIIKIDGGKYKFDSEVEAKEK